MFKKIFMVAFAIMAISFTTFSKAEAAFPTGSAVGANLFAGIIDGGVGVSLKPNNIPAMFGVQLGYGWGGYFNLGLLGDWWAWQTKLGNAGNSVAYFYVGVGGNANFGFSGNFFRFDLSARVPLGFSFIVDRKWEIYMEPALGLRLFTFYTGMSRNYRWFFPAEVVYFDFQFGFRHWF